MILEGYALHWLCLNHAQTTPTFPNDHAQFVNSPDVYLS